MKHNKVLKDINNFDEIKSNMKSPFLSILSRSFLDITSQQIKDHKADYLAKKYAEKWKNYVKRVKHARIVQERSRFWPEP
jgi:hypothetical protein